MKTRFLTVSAYALCCALQFAAAPSHAGPSQGRLARIQETNILVAAYRETSVPFSYLVDGKPVGFSIDLTERIADGLRQQLNVPNLRIRWNASTLSTRIPLIATNTVDIACTADTHTIEREKFVGFSTTYYVATPGVAVAKRSGITDFTQLEKKRVAVPFGSAPEAALRDISTRRQMEISVIPTRVNRLAMQLVTRGEADGYFNADAIVAGEMLLLPDMDQYTIIPVPGHAEALACLLPKGDTAFKHAVDNVLVGMLRSGAMADLYKRWFLQPIPPLGKTIGLPLNSQTLQLYESPSDTALQ